MCLGNDWVEPWFVWVKKERMSDSTLVVKRPLVRQKNNDEVPDPIYCNNKPGGDIACGVGGGSLSGRGSLAVFDVPAAGGSGSGGVQR